MPVALSLLNTTLAHPLLTPFVDIQERATIICGFPKSGTTLLLSLLDSHPQLTTLPEELGFFSKVYQKEHPIRRLLQTNPFAAIRQGVVTTNSVGSGGKRDYSNLRGQAVEARLRSLCQGWNNSKELMLAAIQVWHEAQATPYWIARRRWVEKTPGNEAFLGILNEWFGDQAIYLHVVRDPRDNYATYRRKAGNEGLSLQEFSLRWAFSTERALLAQRRGMNLHIVRYEDLVRRPVEEMARVAGLLGVEERPSLLEPTRNGRPWAGNSVYGTNFNAISTQSLGRYLESLAPGEISAIEQELGGYLLELGYPTGSDTPARSRTIKQVRHELWKDNLRHLHPGLYKAAKILRRMLPYPRAWLAALPVLSRKSGLSRARSDKHPD